MITTDVAALKQWPSDYKSSHANRDWAIKCATSHACRCVTCIRKFVLCSFVLPQTLLNIMADKAHVSL